MYDFDFLTSHRQAAQRQKIAIACRGNVKIESSENEKTNKTSDGEAGGFKQTRRWLAPISRPLLVGGCRCLVK